MTRVLGVTLPLPLLLAGPLIVFLFAALGWILSRLFVSVVTRGVRRTPTDLDDLILQAIRGPLSLAGGLAGIWFALRALPLPAETDLYFNRGWIFVATILLVSIGLRMVNNLTKGIAAKSPLLAGASGIARVIGRIVVLSLGGIMLLQSLGIAVAPLIAGLGIGSLAIGFALKDTFANFFAGVHLFADRAIRVGDYVKLDGGDEGYVEAIGWRATRLRMLANNMIIVPNAKLAESIVTNYALPQPEMSVVTRIPASYESDPDRVMRILEEEAVRAARELPEMLEDPPLVHFSPGFGESALEFSVIVRVRRFGDQVVVQSELRRRIHARFQKEGIQIPYPQRVVHVPEIADLLRSGRTPSVGSGTETPRIDGT